MFLPSSSVAGESHSEDGTRRLMLARLLRGRQSDLAEGYTRAFPHDLPLPGLSGSRGYTEPDAGLSARWKTWRRAKWRSKADTISRIQP